MSAAVADRTPAQVLYSPRALPPRQPAGMSLPFSSHIWVLGTRDPSPARVPYTDQRRRGLARAQVTRAGPYMECLPCRAAPPGPPSCLPEGMGWSEGHRSRRRLRARACAPGAAPVRNAAPPPPTPRALGALDSGSHISPLLRVLYSAPKPSRATPGRGSRVRAGGLRGWEKQSCPPSQTVKEGAPRPAPGNCVSPPSPLRAPNPEGRSKLPLPPPLSRPPPAGGRAAVPGQTAGSGHRGRGRGAARGSRGQAQAVALSGSTGHKAWVTRSTRSVPRGSQREC